MSFTLFPDESFHAELYRSLDHAKSQIDIQVMTFEADAVGLKVAKLLKRARKRGVTIRVIVDCLQDIWVSDRSVIFPSVRVMRDLTLAMYDELRLSNIPVKRTNPTGVFGYRILRRNHKKIFIIDGVAYIGGINLSEHNFRWHDFMVRVTGEKARAVQKDFDFTWSGSPRSAKSTLMSGKFARGILPAKLKTARKECVISSPYVMDYPTVRTLISAARRGVKVKVYTVLKNNLVWYNVTAPYLHGQCAKWGIEVYHYKHFNHAKALIIDEASVIIGSSNFGEASFLKSDICMELTDRKLVRNVREYIDRKDPESVLMQHSALVVVISCIATLLRYGFFKVYRVVVK